MDYEISFLHKEKVLTDDYYSLMVYGYGRSPKRCKINFTKVVLNNELYEINTNFEVNQPYQAEIRYVRQSRISSWKAHNDAVLLNYLCGDNSYCCLKFFHLSYFDEISRITKELVLCSTCYYLNNNNSLWIIYNILSINKKINCNVVHIHGEGHFHCFKCLMDTKNYQQCLRENVLELDECYTYWTSVPGLGLECKI